MIKDLFRYTEIYFFFLNSSKARYYAYLKGGGFIRKALKFASILFGFTLLFTIFVQAKNDEISFKGNVIRSKTKFSQIKSKNAIRVPGFGRMDFVADRKEQSTKLHNPRKNNCYFRISIILDDGTIIWTSDLIAPGEKVEDITLSQTLSEGTYDNVTIKYDCFAMNKKVAFNNAKIKIKLVVKKEEKEG